MPIRAILFDIDGTLIDSNEQHVDAWAAAFRQAGHPQELDAIRGQIGKGGDLLVPALLPGLSKPQQQAVADSHGTHFKAAYLDLVHATGRKAVLASSAKRDELDHYIDLLDARELLSAVTSIDDVGTSKPAPDIFGCAIEKLGVEPAEGVAVGDTPYDVEAAKGAGLVTIGLTSGPFSARRLRDSGSIAVYADAADLLANFDRAMTAAGAGQ